MKKLQIIIILAITVLLSVILFNGCMVISDVFVPDIYALNKESTNPLIGVIIGDLDGAEPASGNAVIIYEDGKTSLRTPGLTQFVADFTVTLHRGEGLRFGFRTNAKDYGKHPAILFDYTINGCRVYENGKLLVDNKSVKSGIKYPARIQLTNDGKYIKISVDCEEIYNSTTSLEATEYVIIESINKSAGVVSGIEFAKVLDANLEYYIKDRHEFLLQNRR